MTKSNPLIFVGIIFVNVKNIKTVETVLSAVAMDLGGENYLFGLAQVPERMMIPCHISGGVLVFFVLHVISSQELGFCKVSNAEERNLNAEGATSVVGVLSHSYENIFVFCRMDIIAEAWDF